MYIVYPQNPRASKSSDVTCRPTGMTETDRAVCMTETDRALMDDGN